MKKIIRRLKLMPLVVFFLILKYFFGMKSVCNILRHISNPSPILKLFGATIGDGTAIYPGIVIHAAIKNFSNLHIGSNCRIMNESFFDLTDKIIINDNCAIGIRNTLITHVNAALSPLNYDTIIPDSGPIELKRGAVTYASATLLHGITIGEKSMIGAGAIVSRDVPPNTVVMGNPARKIKNI